MVYSMTGFGDASAEINGKSYTIEIKSLNGKNSDIRFRSATNLKEREIQLRKQVSKLAMRGKFDINLIVTSTKGEDSISLNKNLMDRYYKDLMAFSSERDIQQGDILQSLIRLPNVVQVSENDITDEEWTLIQEMVGKAVTKLNKFRATEGLSIKEDMLARAQCIVDALESVKPYEEERIDNVKERIRKNLSQQFADEKVDKNRFEQEIIYYIEKLDINEEKVRLTQHCKFFQEALRSDDIEKGRKLSFISQEMGREINTLGSKAQHSDIQQLVVKMKDELEKIKEQVLNIV